MHRFSVYTEGRKLSINFYPFSGDSRGKGFHYVNEDAWRMRSVQKNITDALCRNQNIDAQTLHNIFKNLTLLCVLENHIEIK